MKLLVKIFKTCENGYCHYRVTNLKESVFFACGNVSILTVEYNVKTHIFCAASAQYQNVHSVVYI